jgi:anti-sigma regulatory factor (Ser/Thr protein kinase)
VPTLWVRHAPTSAYLVRRSVAESLRQAGVSDSDTFDAALIASELVGNAVRHAPALPSGHLVIEWSVSGAAYQIAVTDGGAIRSLSIPAADLSDTAGRGLSIVGAISSAWGVTPGEGRTTVWARGDFSTPPRHPLSDQVYAAH